MFEKLAEDIYKTAALKLAVLTELTEKTAGQAANKKLLKAMTLARKGNAPTYGEFVNKIRTIREPMAEHVNQGVDVQRWGNQARNLLASADNLSGLYSAHSNISKVINNTKMSPAQRNRMNYYERKIPLYELEMHEKNFPGIAIPDELRNRYQKAMDNYLNYYFNTFNPMAKGRQNYLSAQRGIYRDFGRYENEAGTKLLGSLPATESRYDMLAHRETMSPENFKREFNNTAEQLRSKANQNVMANLRKVDPAKFRQIRGMSMQKAIDRYGGGMDSALFRGGDTNGIDSALRSGAPEKAVTKVLSIAQGPFGGTKNIGGMRSTSSNMGHVAQGHGGGDYYANNAGNLIFLSGIPQVPLGYSLKGENRVSAVPFAIGNGKMIKHLSQVSAQNNAIAQGKAHDPARINRVTDTHGHWATTNLHDIDKRMTAPGKDSGQVYNAANRDASDPSFSNYYETQVPYQVLNTPGVYTRGVVVGRNNGINYNSFGNPSTVDANGPVNGYKNLMTQTMQQNNFNNNYAFFPAEEFQKAAVPIQNARDAYKSRNSSLEDALRKITNAESRPYVSGEGYPENYSAYSSRWYNTAPNVPKMRRDFLNNDQYSPIHRYYDKTMGKYRDGWSALLDDATIYK